jgi:hypothetical protein
MSVLQYPHLCNLRNFAKSQFTPLLAMEHWVEFKSFPCVILIKIG